MPWFVPQVGNHCYKEFPLELPYVYDRSLASSDTPAENKWHSHEICFPNHDIMNAFLISSLGGINITQVMVAAVLTLTPPGKEAEWIQSHYQEPNPAHAARSTLSCADFRNSSLRYAMARYWLSSLTSPEIGHGRFSSDVTLTLNTIECKFKHHEGNSFSLPPSIIPNPREAPLQGVPHAVQRSAPHPNSLPTWPLS
jgi:hypothetical protein